VSELSTLEVCTVVLLKIQGFWNVMSGDCINIYRDLKDNTTFPSFKMSGTIYPVTKHNVPEESNLEEIFPFTNVPNPSKE
jgi:hypothetical protein